MRAPSGRRRRPRDARGGGACERRAAERHDLRECDRGRGAAHGDVRGERRRRLVPLGARQRRDGGRPHRQRDLRPRAVDRDGDRDGRRRLDGAGERHGALGGGHAAAGGREPLREARRLSGAESCRRSQASRWRSTCADARWPRRSPTPTAPSGCVSRASARPARTRRGRRSRLRRRSRSGCTPCCGRRSSVRGPSAGGWRSPRGSARRGGHALDPPLPRRRAHAQVPRRSRRPGSSWPPTASPDYRAVVRVEPAQGWLGAVRIARAHVLCARHSQARDGYGDGLVFYGGAGYQPLLSFAALNQLVLEQRCGAVRRLASALLARAVHSGDAAYWDYNFPFQGGPVPWRSGFAQAVAAQALARAGVMLRDPALTAVAAASFRGLRRTLLIPLAGGSWIREYGFTGQVILNAQLQSIISLQSYAAVADSAPARRLVRELVVATQRLLPSFDLGCWARYQLGGGAASLHYQAYHVELLRRLAATHPRADLATSPTSAGGGACPRGCEEARAPVVGLRSSLRRLSAPRWPSRHRDLRT